MLSDPPWNWSSLESTWAWKTNSGHGSPTRVPCLRGWRPDLATKRLHRPGAFPGASLGPLGDARHAPLHEPVPPACGSLRQTDGVPGLVVPGRVGVKALYSLLGAPNPIGASQRHDGHLFLEELAHGLS